MITWLHGLFGAPTDFGAVARVLGEGLPQAAMALPGHAGAAALDPSDEPGFEDVATSLMTSLTQAGVQKTALVGYSMGARLAMHIALSYPDRITGLVLVGGHPGIDNPQTRTGRLLLDEKRASLLRANGLRSFLETWYQQPLFAGFRASRHFEDIFESRCHGDGEAVANTLERLSVGHQEPLGEAMAACAIPTLWVAGADDARYVACLQPIAEAQATGRFVAIEGSGHAVPSEAPAALGHEISAFFSENSASESGR